MFMKQDAQGQDICRWRIQSEGMPILEPWVGEDRIVRLYKKPTLHKLLIEMFPKLSQGGWTNLGEVGERVNNIGMGCCVLRVEPSDCEDGFELVLIQQGLHFLADNFQGAYCTAIVEEYFIGESYVAQRRAKVSRVICYDGNHLTVTGQCFSASTMTIHH